MIWQRAAYWTAEEDRQLRILWNAGWSVLSIGATLGRGKNAVCGRARRLGLVERGSPITAKPCPNRQREMQAGLEAAREAIARAA